MEIKAPQFRGVDNFLLGFIILKRYLFILSQILYNQEIYNIIDPGPSLKYQTLPLYSSCIHLSGSQSVTPPKDFSGVS